VFTDGKVQGVGKIVADIEIGVGLVQHRAGARRTCLRLLRR
jgi:hypothetical protein